MSWPGNYAGQALAVAQYEKRLLDIQKVQIKVVIHSWKEPTQQEFEAAYVAQTGFTLPIPPGALLLWSDMRNGGMTRAYTVANDLANGTLSSGTIVPYIEAQTTSPFRFLGHSYAKANWARNNLMRITGPGAEFFTAPSEWQRRGLAMLWIYFSIRMSTSAANALIMHPSQSANANNWSDFSIEVAGQNTDDLVRVTVNAGGTTVNNSQNTSAGGSHTLIDAATDDNDVADAYMSGVMYVWDPFDVQDPNGDPVPAAFGSSGGGYAASIGATIATGNLNVCMFDWEKTDNLPSLSGPGLASTLGNNTAIDKKSKIWWYGIFNQDAPMMMPEYS